MSAHAIQSALADMVARDGFFAAGLVELEGGMVWHAEGSADLCDAVISSVSDHWRLYRRSQDVFAPLGPLHVVMLYHRAGRITVCECGPAVLLVVITERMHNIDWTHWKADHARLVQLIRSF